jgi:hypothetical protein
MRRGERTIVQFDDGERERRRLVKNDPLVYVISADATGL